MATAAVGEPVIQMDGLSKHFRLSNNLFSSNKLIIRAVDSVSMTINRGEIVGLVGESGSGKTTLARVILGLTPPSESTVYVDGIDVAKASANDRKRLHREVAVVFQDPSGNLNPRQTALGSIMRPLRLHGASRAKAKERAREVMESIRMDDRYLHSFPHQLSGGQCQRIAIARALALNPKIMILDEPTSALDISVQAQILNLLLDIQEALSLTYLVITHDLNVIRYVSDRMAVMYLGRLMEFGPTDEILRNPRHPYTQGLLAALPVMNPKERAREKPLMTGDPGSLIELPEGCRYHPRCPRARDQCRRETPPDAAISPDHIAACFYPAD
ncbi:MAG: ABC transporter ATP-binding protein [Oscillospiraceae bacterium]|jgi:oligopeptide/dipeptide ABC transporter ATP-binding protein|nr:ABC transporter ATP-binding protein [Oscillospiraceae bacterium]